MDWPLRRERSAAAAGGRGVGVAELETAAVEAGLKVDDYALQEWRAYAIDKDLHAIPFEHRIARLGFFVEVELVRMAGTATIGDRYAQTLSNAIVAHQKPPDLLERGLGQGQIQVAIRFVCNCHNLRFARR